MSIIANISKKRVSQCARGELIRIGGSYRYVLGFYLSEAEGFDGAIEFINLASDDPLFRCCRCSFPTGRLRIVWDQMGAGANRRRLFWVHNPAHSNIARGRSHR